MRPRKRQRWIPSDSESESDVESDAESDAESESDAEPDAGGVSASLPRAQPPLHRDMLHCVFAYLSLSGLHSVLAVSREWSATARCLPCLGITLEIAELRASAHETRMEQIHDQADMYEDEPVEIEFPPEWRREAVLSRVCASSALIRHCHVMDCVDADTKSELSVKPAMLARIAEAAPQLRKLTVRIDNVTAVTGWSFPMQLRSLVLVLHIARAGDMVSVQCALDCIAHMQQLETLALHVVDYKLVKPRLSYLPLAQCARLASLDMYWKGSVPRSQPGLTVITANAQDVRELLEAIRLMPSLTQLNLENGRIFCDHSFHGGADLLTEFTRKPHTMRLASLKLRLVEIEDQHVRALLHLPTLTACEPSMMRCSSLDWVLSLPLLRTLSICVRIPESDVLCAELVVICVQLLTSLESLELAHPRITSTQLSALLQPLTQLRSLTLQRMSAMTTLAFLSSGSLSRTLTTLILKVQTNTSLRAEDIKHVHQLTSLESLTIIGFWVETLSVEATNEFELPSRLMPSLRHWRFDSRE
jgi:hypothetical protein